MTEVVNGRDEVFIKEAKKRCPEDKFIRLIACIDEHYYIALFKKPSGIIKTGQFKRFFASVLGPPEDEEITRKIHSSREVLIWNEKEEFQSLVLDPAVRKPKRFSFYCYIRKIGEITKSFSSGNYKWEWCILHQKKLPYTDKPKLREIPYIFKTTEEDESFLERAKEKTPEKYDFILAIQTNVESRTFRFAVYKPVICYQNFPEGKDDNYYKKFRFYGEGTDCYPKEEFIENTIYYRDGGSVQYVLREDKGLVIFVSQKEKVCFGGRNRRANMIYCIPNHRRMVTEEGYVSK